jgi:membrane protein DedA with SNARE-associated domain
MPDPGELTAHWGYLAVFLIVVLGNMGLPIPEEAVLVLAGYMVWTGQLRLVLVLAVGIVSAIVGDNMGYWLGHRWGRGPVERHAWWVLGTPGRLDAMRTFVRRHGPMAVLVARFIPGLRFAAGPLAGALGLRFAHFLAANVIGAALYVPLAVAAGYAIGMGLGDYVERFRGLVGEIERLALIAGILGAAVLLLWRGIRWRRP